MRMKVRCNCGWQRELSEFYAGKRIRCADCSAIVEVPGERPVADNRGAYLYPPMIDWPSGRHVKPRGRWVNVNARTRQVGAMAPSSARFQAAPGTRRSFRWKLLSCVVLLQTSLILLPVLLGGPRPAPDSQHQREPSVTHSYSRPDTRKPTAKAPVGPAQGVEDRKTDNPPPPEEAPSESADPNGEREDEF